MENNYEECLLDDAKIIMIKILKEIHRVCEKHNIKYFISDGTLLGAVRHGGFIPWDDDIDISMLREDYDKFINIGSNELKEEFFLQTADTDKDYNVYGTPLKVRHKNSIYREKWDVYKGRYSGIFVDIFPFDKVPDKELKRKFQFKLSKALITSKLKINFSDGVNLKSIARSSTQLLGKCINYKFIRKILHSTLKWNNDSKSNKVKYGVELVWDLELPIEAIFPLKPIKFEGDTFWGPNDPDKVLSIQYGDYMKLPPESERATHAEYIAIKKN